MTMTADQLNAALRPSNFRTVHKQVRDLFIDLQTQQGLSIGDLSMGLALFLSELRPEAREALRLLEEGVRRQAMDRAVRPYLNLEPEEAESEDGCP